MSKLPRISAHNSDGFKSTLPQIVQTPNFSQTEPRIQNGGNLDFPPISKFTTPNGQTSNHTHEIIYESKLNEFEAKLARLEQANQILLSRLNDNERDFQFKLQELQLGYAEERENRFKNEKNLSNIIDQNNLSSIDLKTKMSSIEDLVNKGEKWKVIQRDRDIEMYKNLINKLTEKVSETVKMEVEARFKADMDNKIFTQSLTKKFQNEIEVLRKDIDDYISQTKIDVQTISKECSERTHNVSKYIDQQIQEAVYGKGSSNEILKNFVHKLTEQIKTNLISQNNQNAIYEKRLTKIEAYLSQIKNDTYNFVNLIEQRLISKMEDCKLFSELNIKKTNEDLNAIIKELSKNVDANIELLSTQLIDTRLRTNDNFNYMEDKNLGRFKTITKDLEEICNRIYRYEDTLKKHDEFNIDMKAKIEKEVASMKTEIDVQIVQERMTHTIENHMLREEIENLKNSVLAANTEFSNKIYNLDRDNHSSHNNFNDEINVLRNQLLQMGESNEYFFNKFENTFKMIEVQMISNEIVGKTESNYFSSEIQRSKNVGKNNSNNITELFKKVNENQIKLDEISSTLKNSGLDVSKIQDRIAKMKENETLEDVKRVTENMINYVEREINTENYNELVTENEAKLEKKIKKVEEEIKTLKKKMNAKPSKKESNADTKEMEVKCTMAQILNNVEFNNIYSLLGKRPAQKEDSEDKDEEKTPIDTTEIDNKLKKLEEKIKDQNLIMWNEAVKLANKIEKTEELNDIIKNVPPVVSTIPESLRMLLDINYQNNEFPIPNVPTLKTQLKWVYSHQGKEEAEGEDEEQGGEEEEEEEREEDEDNDKSVKTPSRSKDKSPNKSSNKSPNKTPSKSKSPESEGEENSKTPSKKSKGGQDGGGKKGKGEAPKEKALSGGVKKSSKNSGKDTSKFK